MVQLLVRDDYCTSGALGAVHSWHGAAALAKKGETMTAAEKFEEALRQFAENAMEWGADGTNTITLGIEKDMEPVRTAHRKAIEEARHPPMAAIEALRKESYERGRREGMAVALAEVCRHLVKHDQRPVSWHEVQDCLEAIRARGAK